VQHCVPGFRPVALFWYRCHVFSFPFTALVEIEWDDLRLPTFPSLLLPSYLGSTAVLEILPLFWIYRALKRPAAGREGGAKTVCEFLCAKLVSVELRLYHRKGFLVCLFVSQKLLPMNKHSMLLFRFCKKIISWLVTSLVEFSPKFRRNAMPPSSELLWDIIRLVKPLQKSIAALSLYPLALTFSNILKNLQILNCTIWMPSKNL
jgi:hypothetical protein